jgi:signal transduction histidine kinase
MKLGSSMVAGVCCERIKTGAAGRPNTTMVAVTTVVPRIGGFGNEAAHALRTPLTIMRGHLQLLEDDPAERAETLRLVINEVDRMGRLIDDLVVLARVDEPDFLDVERLALGELTREIFVKAETLGPRRWMLDDAVDAEIDADRNRLTTAMLKLAMNAVDYTEPGSEVGVGSAVRDGEAWLWVRDNGCGVTPGEESRVFERFRRGADGRHRPRGAGLGLAVAQAISAAHGGRIELANRPGEGARFTLVIPQRGPPR